MKSNGVVRFFSGEHSGGESAQVHLVYGPGTASPKDRLNEALAAVRRRRVILACAMLLTFFLALSAFIMAFDDGDQATTSPTTTTIVASADIDNQTSPTTIGTTRATTTTDRPSPTTTTTGRPVASTAAAGSSRTPWLPKCGANWQRFRSQCYRVTSSSDFAGVEAECERSFKGSLVSVHDEKENAFIAKFVRTSHAAEKEFYIGLTRNFTGHWIWLDESALNYTAWKPEEPSENSTSDHCVQVATAFGPMSGRWEVVSCNNERPAVCKRDLLSFGDGGESEVPFTHVRTTTAFVCPAGYMCGGGTISSPNYPRNYGNYADVTYHLLASSPDSVVVLTFATIKTETSHDTVTIYDGAQVSAPVLKTYSGYYYSAEVVRSTGQYMTVRFITDGSETRIGFTATFASQNPQ